MRQDRRRRRAGLIQIKKVGQFRLEVPVKFRCQHCGQEFTPQRRTARFCGAKCRVYWSRAHPKAK
jgi:hypothetical protein